MVAASLAAAWAPAHRVTLIDIDPQRTLKRWHTIRTTGPAAAKLSPLAFSDVSGWRLQAEIDRLQREADIVIIDTPPQVEADAARAIRAASLVLIPVQPSPPDLWAAEGTVTLALAERRRVALVLNRAVAKSRLRASVESEIARRGLLLLPATLGNRSFFAQAFAQGMGVTETHPRSPAADELKSLAQAVLEAAQ
jgi:chromosome partitioning protein